MKKVCIVTVLIKFEKSRAFKNVDFKNPQREVSEGVDNSIRIDHTFFSLFIRLADYVWYRHIFSLDVSYSNLLNLGITKSRLHLAATPPLLPIPK